jgi:hypothetical protein
MLRRSTGLRLRSYEELENYLRTFHNWKDPEGEFDFSGAVGLLAASLDCLRKTALDHELEDLGEYLEDEQAGFLIRLASLVRPRST